LPKRYTLVGPNAGKTIHLGPQNGGYDFKNGEYIFPGSDQDALLLERIMIPFYSAYPDSQLRSAQEAYAVAIGQPVEPAAIVSEADDDAAEKEAADKAAEKEAADKAAAEKEAADKAAAEKEAVAKAAAEKEAADKVAAASQSGTEPTSPTLEAVVKGLDPANDEHWTSRGVPSMEAIEKVLGKSVTREEVEAAAPGLTRTKAKAAAAKPVDPLD
jgi:hypothetical protein